MPRISTKIQAKLSPTSSSTYEVLQYDIRDNVVDLIITGCGWRIERTVTYSKIDSREKLARWVVVQAKPPVPVSSASQIGDFTVDIRTDTTLDPLSGSLVDVDRVMRVRTR